MNRKYFFLPEYSICTVTLFCSFVILTNHILACILIVGMGQAHFIHAYLYQFRAGKMNLDFFLKISIGACLWLFVYNFFPDKVFILGVFLFILHNFLDGKFITGISRDAFSLMSLFFIGYCSWSVYYHGYPLVSALMASFSLVLAVASSSRFYALQFVLPFFVGSWCLYFWPGSLDVMAIFAASILGHYLVWTVYIFSRHSTTGKKVSFSLESIFLFCSLILLITWVANNPNMHFFNQIFFSLDAYIFWTSLHIFSTIRMPFIGIFGRRIITQ